MQLLGSPRLGSHLKHLREERKLTLGGVENLSADHGERINKSYLFRVERGKTLPTLPRLYVLAQVYRVTLGGLVEVLEGAVEEHRHASEPEAVIESRDFDELRERGISAVKAGEFSKAAILFRAACERAGREPASREQSARIATAKHDLSIALKNARQLDLARQQAEDALEHGDLPETLRDRIRLNLSDIYRRIGRRALAAEVLDGLMSRRDELHTRRPRWCLRRDGLFAAEYISKRCGQEFSLCLGVERKRKNRFEICKLLLNVGLAEQKAGNYDRAMKSLLEARESAQRCDFSYQHAASLTAISRNHFLKNDTREARAAFREANERARRGDYFHLLFINHYYQWRIATAEGDLSEAKAAESGLRFFITRFDEPCEELEAYRKERQ